MKFLFIDNYDSFTYNLIHLLKRHWKGVQYFLFLNDDPRIMTMKSDGLIISPGPMSPIKSGLALQAVKNHLGKPILGVCLGMQIINEYFKGQTVRSKIPRHGQSVPLIASNSFLYRGIRKPLLPARYNSLCCVVKDKHLRITGKSMGEPMSVEHDTFPIAGVQFHPESFLTDFGGLLINNFYKYYVYDTYKNQKQIN